MDCKTASVRDQAFSFFLFSLKKIIYYGLAAGDCYFAFAPNLTSSGAMLRQKKTAN